MAKKVAYVVFKGHKPGVYNTWLALASILLLETIAYVFTRMETENQVRGYSGADFKGYTAADGGHDKAKAAYEEYVKSKQSENAVPSKQRDVDESMNPTM